MSSILKTCRRWHELRYARIALMLCAVLLLPVSVYAELSADAATRWERLGLVSALAAAVITLAGVVTYLYTRTEVKYGEVLKYAFERERVMVEILTKINDTMLALKTRDETIQRALVHCEDHQREVAEAIRAKRGHQ